MSNMSIDGDEKRLKSVVRDGFLARDRAMRAPAFVRVWPSTVSSRPSAIFRRPAFAAFAAVAVLAGVFWVFLGRYAGDPVASTAEDATVALARQLSAPDYWRVPTDVLLAFAAPPLNADLPSPEGFHVSLEESLL